MTNNIQGNSRKIIIWFISRNSAGQKGMADIFKVMKGKNLQPRIHYPEGSHSDLTEKSKASQTNKS